MVISSKFNTGEKTWVSKKRGSKRLIPEWWRSSILTGRGLFGSAGLRTLTDSEDSDIIWKGNRFKNGKEGFRSDRHRRGHFKMKVKRSVGGQGKVNGRSKGLSLAQWVNCLLLQRSIKSCYHLKTSNPAKRLEPFNHSISARSLCNSLMIGVGSEGFLFCRKLVICVEPQRFSFQALLWNQNC